MLFIIKIAIYTTNIIHINQKINAALPFIPRNTFIIKSYVKSLLSTKTINKTYTMHQKINGIKTLLNLFLTKTNKESFLFITKRQKALQIWAHQ